MDVSSPAYAHALSLKKLALAAGGPVAVADDLPRLGHVAPTDAFDIGLTLLKRYGDNPEVWKSILIAQPDWDKKIGSKDEILGSASPQQLDAAMRLAECERTESCELHDSLQLQFKCALDAHCSVTVSENVRDYLLSAKEFADLPRIAARFSELITARRWDLLGYAPENRPAQSKPSIIKPPPGR